MVVKRRKEFFDRCAPVWKDTGPVLPLRRVVREAGLEKGFVVCDVGSGTGVLIHFILRRIGPKGRVVAFDYAPAMIEKARQKKFSGPVELLVADIHQTGTASVFFDAVICNACFPHFRNKAMALREIKRILKPGGLLVISHPTGRDFVNNLHRQAGDPVRKDVVPPAEKAVVMLRRAGFTPVKTIDEPNFYLVSARLPRRMQRSSQ